MPYVKSALPLLFTSILSAASPVITSIQNPASNILPGLPNFGIAQGEIFVLYGTDMGPTTLVQASALPLPTTLPAGIGTQVKITQNGTVYNAPIIYVLNTQIAAVMPSNIPVNGTGPLAGVQVIYNGVAGNTFATTIVNSNFGISTVDQTGGGRAVITDPSYAVITPTNSALPGITYTMWGTGLGPSDSDTNLATKGTFPTIHVFVGGVEASVTYSGLSGGVGLNQINFTIPVGLSGCNVSLIVQSDTTPARVSNATTIPIAPNGGVCTDVYSPLPPVIDSALKKGSVTLGAVTLDGDQKQATALFLRFTPAQYAAAGNRLSNLTPGSCTTFVQLGSGGAHSGNPNDGLPESTGVDAGSGLTVTPPGGPITRMPLLQAGIYQSNITAVTSGSYGFSGTGGKDIAPFAVSVNGPPAFTWTNPTIKTVVRSQGLRITWAGGDANSSVNISGYANGNPITVNGQSVPSNTYTQFECLAAATAGSFTVPPSILLALPAVNGNASNGGLFVYLQANPQILTFPGADYSFSAWNTATASASVAYQ